MSNNVLKTILAIVLWFASGFTGLFLTAKYGNGRPIHAVAATIMVGTGPLALGIGLIGMGFAAIQSETNTCVLNCEVQNERGS